MPIDADEVKEVKALMQQVSNRRDEISERMENFRDDIVDQIDQFRSEIEDDISQLGQMMAAVSRKLEASFWTAVRMRSPLEITTSYSGFSRRWKP